MESTPLTGLDDLDRHLDDLVNDPTLLLNPKLFDDVELQLTGMSPKSNPLTHHDPN